MSKAMIWVTEQDGGGFVVHRRASPSANVTQIAMDSLLCPYCGYEVPLSEIGQQWMDLEGLHQIDREPICGPCKDLIGLWAAGPVPAWSLLGNDDDDDEL